MIKFQINLYLYVTIVRTPFFSRVNKYSHVLTSSGQGVTLKNTVKELRHESVLTAFTEQFT